MDNYEINILRRGGNWKKVKSGDLTIDEINKESKEEYELNDMVLQQDILTYVNKVDSIITKIEALETEKNKLKDELKICEDEFLMKKKLAEDEIDKISQEKEIIEKTINVIKNLKSF